MATWRYVLAVSCRSSEWVVQYEASPECAAVEAEVTRLAPAGRSNMWTDLAVAAAAGKLGGSDNDEADEPFFSTVTPVWWGLKTFAKVRLTTSRYILGVKECWVEPWGSCCAAWIRPFERRTKVLQPDLDKVLGPD